MVKTNKPNSDVSGPTLVPDIVQFIFYFWSFEISRNILRNQKNTIGLDSYILNSCNYLNLIWIYISHCMTSLLKHEVTV